MNENNIARVPRNCELRIRAVYGSLKTAERKAVDFILERPEVISTMTIVEVARQADCSEATIVRLAKRLGYGGFPELKADFAQNENGQDASRFSSISHTDGPVLVMEKVVETTIVALRDMFSILDQKQYENALEALVKAHSILFLGVGDGAPVAMEACRCFLRLGQMARFSEDPDMQVILASQLSKGDVLVAIAHSGKGRPVVNTVKTARQAGATVVAITNYPVSPLTKNADIVLLTAAFAQNVTGEVISERVAQLCLIESLYINYLIRKRKVSLQNLSISAEAVKINHFM
jgi:DNA-binding MurR/RpiR family transcriptional regulator